MANRKSHPANSSKSQRSDSDARNKAKQRMRSMLLETLESRQLLAVGPQLIGIQPNNSDLLIDGAVRTESPRELTFRFDDSQVIHPSTLDGIRISRSGGDGSFGLATLASDFGTAGEVELQLTSASPDVNPIVQVTSADLGANQPPTLSVSGATVSITLNSNFTTPTTAAELVTAINGSSVVSPVLTARVNGGFATTPIGSSNPSSYSPLNLQQDGDLIVDPGNVVIGDSPNDNEITVRFGGALPNDLYRVEIFGFDDAVQGIVGLRGTTPTGTPGDLFMPTVEGTRKDTIEFRLDLGPQVTSVVPQPVVRSGSALTQLRDTIVVYFDGDKLLVENDATGAPTSQSAENPEFYQLIFTDDTVRNTDDQFFLPQSVEYNAASNTATLRFGQDIDNLPGSGFASKTYRLRIGSRESAPIVPRASEAAATAISDFNTGGAAKFRFTARQLGEAGSGIQVVVVNSNDGDPPEITASGRTITVDLGSNNVTAGQLLAALQTASASSSLVSVQLEPGSDASVLLNAPINYSPITVVGLGSSFDTSTDIGVLGSSVTDQTSLILTSEINAVPFGLDLPGASNDPGHRQLPADLGGQFEQHINERFGASGADNVDGITTIHYNFQRIYGADGSGSGLVNAITAKQQERAREVMQIWANQIGVQFIETPSEGITIATGSFAALQGTSPDIVIENSISMGVRIDPAFERSLLVLDAGRQWGDNYGEDWFRASLTGLGMLLGLERADDLPSGTLMALSAAFVNAGNSNATPADEPVFPGTFDVLHGEHVFRNDSNDIDLYKFEVDFGSQDRVGLFVAETFAERLTNSSPLDSLLHLYKQNQAFAESNLAAGANLNVRFDAVAPGRLGNNLQVFVTKSERGAGAGVIVNVFENLVTVDLNSTAGEETTAQELVDAINANPAASALVTVSLLSGDGSTAVGDRDITYSPIVLQSGDIELIARNDDYFSEDSLIQASLGTGTYYIGVSASGNDSYDPVIEDTGLGGTTQGKYDLRITFRAQTDTSDVLRDVEGGFVGDEAITFDGDGDGVPGGIYNFWFQTRPLNRTLSFTAGGVAGLDGQIMTLTGANGVVRRFEFTSDGTVGIGNVPVLFSAATTAGDLASTLAGQIRARAELGINATSNGSQIVLVGEREIQLSPNLSTIEVGGRTIFVDKTAGPNADGSLARPFNNIAGVGVPNAFGVAQPGDIVRILGNGGGDGNIATLNDNLAYEIGFGLINGGPLSDGSTMEVPQGVTTMVDAGAIFKMRRSRIGVGSSSLGVDRSGGALQILGTPFLSNAAGGVLRNVDGSAVKGSVYFTSWLDESIGQDTYAPQTAPSVGDWGGISYRNDVDSSAGRRNLEDEGIFLQYVNHADLRFGGGGNVVIDSVQQVVNPIQMIDVRPTVTFNSISNSADAAMSAAPNSFEETNFHEPRFQLNGSFTSDYTRVGPEIHHNALVNNSLNGLFVKVDTPAGNAVRPLTVPARFNDIDITHIVSENIIISGTPGGALLDSTRPLANLVALQPTAGGTLLPGTYNYKVSFVDAAGYETPASDASGNVVLTPSQTAVRLFGLPLTSGEFVARRLYRSDSLGGGQYQLVAEIDAVSSGYLDTGLNAGGVLQRDRASVAGVNLLENATSGTLLAGDYNYRLVMVDAAGREGIASDPTANITVAAGSAISVNNLPPTQSGFVGRKLYRSEVGGGGPWILVANLGAAATTYVDNGSDQGQLLSPLALGTLRPRLDASLVVDPGAIIKFEGARIEIEQGANLIAEGTDGAPIVFTSKLDDRYGAGGSFDTNNDDDDTTPQPRDWGGIYASIGSTISLDYATVAYAGGVTKIEGTFKAFNPVEIQQADARITNSTFEFNEDGIGGQGPLNRLGRLDNRSATIFIRGSQPILVGNTFSNNTGSPINIDANSFNADLMGDMGRSTGDVDRIDQFDNNRGPLVRDNRLDNNDVNGMEIRGDLLTVESVWDDTDIVHVLFNSITVTNVHHEGGLRLQSSPTESLVVKLLGYGANHNLTAGTGLTATGFFTNAADRVGGTIEIIGQPGFPVVMTSYHDDTVGAGLKPDGTPQTDTNNNGISTVPRAADWRSVLLDQFSNDRNVATVLEIEDPNAIAPGFNSTSATAQLLGDLAGNASSSDESLRLGFVVQGVLSEPADVDVYSFTAEAGTEIWIDVDDTTQSLDLMIELLNANGQLLARSDNSGDETVNPALLVRTSEIAPSLVNPLNSTDGTFRTNASGSLKEDGTINPRDAGMRVLLPGAPGSRTTFHFRVRSASTNPEDFNAGLTSGSYEVQVRTREAQEFPGSTVQYADIRYATNGVHIQGLPGHSPLLGEAQEDESSVNGSYADNDVNSFLNESTAFGNPGTRDQYIGNLLGSDRATISVGGELAAASDLDFYRFDVNYVDTNRGGTATGPNVVFDLDYADGLNRADTNLSVFRVIPGFGGDTYQLVLFAEDSNIADDIRGPLSQTDISDFSRGSVGPKDPFIGAVHLPEGTYSVAVTASGRVPSALAGATREPIYQTLNENISDTTDTNPEMVSGKFTLAGYSALDVPRLYLNYTGNTSQIIARDGLGNETVLGTTTGAGQQIINLSAIAGTADLELVFRPTAGNISASASIIIGFAERGERIIGAAPTPQFVGRSVPGNTIQAGEYQLEIRQSLDSITDTNDRAADQITLVAPDGASLVDGDTFVLRDAGNELTFEFTSDGSVIPGNVAVQFAAGDSAAAVATSMRNAINDPGVQSRLAVKAAGSDGSETGPMSSARVNLFGRASGEFGKVGVIFHSGSSDQNINRDQGQVLIQNNFIRHSRDYGVWTEPGERQRDARDLLINIAPNMINAMSDRPATGNSAPGAVRNLREINDAILGGFNPGIIISNNILESGGLGGVHVAGENPIWMLTPTFLPGPDDNGMGGDSSSSTSNTNPIDHFGTFIDDGDLLVIDGGRTRVQLEFEDLSGAATGTPTWGSGLVQGDGWDDESIPAYYREDGGQQYLRAPGTPPPGYSSLEVLQSIRDSLFGSILVTNGTTQTITATVAPSLLAPSPGADPFSSSGYINYYNRPALYLEGVSNINWVDRNGPGFNPFDYRRVDAADTPQPFVRVVNNTIYGSDGRASFAADTEVSEPNDTIAGAVETWQGTAHNPLSFTMDAVIGDSSQFGADATQDVDLYKFKLDVGERARIDIDTIAGAGLDAVLQIFDASGVAQTFTDSNGNQLTISDNEAAPGETLGSDPYIDFTAMKPGVYYAAISASGNDGFDPLSLGGRVTAATSGPYSIDLQVLHPQEFTITVEDPSQYPAGSTFTVFQVAEFAGGGNSRTFEFVAGGGGASGTNIPINIDYANFRAPDVARAIADAITASDLNNIQTLDNGIFNDASPLAQVEGRALGGIAGVEGLRLFPRRNDGLFPTHSSLGIGHDRQASTRQSTTSPGDGTTERFVVVSNAAWIDGNGVIQVDPDVNENNNLDQLLPETGILVSAGASPTLMNNVMVNVQTPIIREETRVTNVTRNNPIGRRTPADFGTQANVLPKPGEVIIGGSVYQFAEPAEANNRLGFGIEATPTNLPNTGLDFNFTLPPTSQVFVDAQASQFLPAVGSRIIDSSLDSLEEREAFRTVKEAVGISVSPVLAPSRDATGQLRVDDPSVAPPNGQGADVFKDRGALDRADFVGPSAEALRPLDNDSRGVDRDSAISVIQLNSGVYPEFRVQLVDGFEVADPFPGIGIDDSTVVGPQSGLRLPGAAVTLFENGRLLTEGIDYRFSYNTTTNEMIFTPLAGVWKNDRVYEIGINNKNRFVVVAPAGDQVSDGDSFTITDREGGVVFFEFDSGYRLQVPEGLIIEVPLAGGAAGGVADGDRFSITINGARTTFEFDRNGNSLAGNLPIVFQQGVGQDEIVSAIFTAIENSGLPVTPRVLDGGSIYLGANAGVRLDTTFATLSQPAPTLGFRMPPLGPRPGGITDGQTFTVSDGRRTVVFEYDTDGNVQAGNQQVDFTSAVTAADLTQITHDALVASPLNVSPSIVAPDLVHIGLSASGSADVGSSLLSLLGVSRALADGEQFTVATATGTETFEFSRDGSVSPGNILIPVAIADTEAEIGQRIANAITDAGLGLTPVHVGGGNIAIGGNANDNINTSGAPALGLFGTPGVQSASTLQVFGPLLLQVPARGAGDLVENATFSITNNGNTVVFEFDSDFSGASQAGNVVITYDALSTQNDITLSVITAINAAGLGIGATNLGGGLINLGALQDNQVSLNNSNLAASRGVVSDGESFTISNGIQSVTFEFENVDFGNGFGAGNSPILFSSSSTVDSVVASMKAVIEGSGLGLVPTALPGGILELNDTPKFTVNAAGAPTLILSGVPGGANAVSFIQDPSFTGADMKLAMIRAINDSFESLLIAKDRGGATLFVENAAFVSPEMDSYFLRGVADLAGNLLKPNRINNETQFTILMPGVTLDYGDAPDPFTTTSGRYPTQHLNDGARHVVGNTAILGATIDSETDGQPTPGADGDADDGVVFGANLNEAGIFNKNIFTSIEVTMAGPGYVDAWIDFNADGDWDDPGERVLSSTEFTAQTLTQTFLVTMPSTAPTPLARTTSFARFRSSSTGGLIPTGLAVDGEVEDYEVTLVPGTPPRAVNDNYSVNEDSSLVTSDATGNGTPSFTIDDGFAANDVDPEGGPLSVQVIDRPAVGTLLENNDGTFSYTPPANFNGEVTFTYKVNDGVLNSNNVGTVTITVNEVNDAPIANDDTLTTDEDAVLDLDPSALIANDFAGSDASEDSQTLTITAVSSVSTQGGTVTLSGGRVIYTPPNNFSGTDEFVYTVTDNGTTGGVAAPLSASATVTVTVLDKNDPPITVPITVSTAEDTSTSVSIASMIADDLPGPPAESGQTVLFDGVEPMSNNGGTVVIDGANVIYTPPADFVGTDTFFYTVIDNGTSGGLPDPQRSTGTVTVTVTPVNDAPRVSTPFGSVSMQEDEAARIINLNNVFFDPDVFTSGDTVTYSIVSNSNTGLVTPSVNAGQLELQLLADQNGQSVIVVRATDVAGESITDTLTLNVIPVNDAPRLAQALPDVTVNEDATAPQLVLSPQYFFDPDVLLNGDVLTFALVSNSNPLLVTPQIAGSTLTLNLSPNQSGSAVITISATDSDGQTITDTFNLIVNPVNDLPITQPDSYTVAQGQSLTTTDPRGLVGGPEDDGVLANDRDPEGAVLSAVLVDGPQAATAFALNSNGTFTYRHDFNSGRTSDTFTYRATDGSGQSVVTTVTINIGEPPPPPHQNPVMNLDVNADGFVTPIDALLIVNFLNTTGSTSVEGLPSPPPYRDVNGDNSITPIDALIVINELNQSSGGGGGEGEGGVVMTDALVGAFASQDVGRHADNSRIGMRVVDRPANEIYGPMPSAAESIFGEIGSNQAPQFADTSWVEDGRNNENDAEIPVDLALSSLLADLDGHGES